MTALGMTFVIKDDKAGGQAGGELTNCAIEQPAWTPDSIAEFMGAFNEPAPVLPCPPPTPVCPTGRGRPAGGPGTLSADRATPGEIVDYALSLGVTLTTDGDTIKPLSDNPLSADLVGIIKSNKPLIIKEIRERERRWRYELTHYLGVTDSYLANKGILFWRDTRTLWATCAREVGDRLKSQHPEVFTTSKREPPEPVTPGACIYYQPDPINPEAGGGRCKCNGLNSPDKYIYPMRKTQCSVYKPVTCPLVAASDPPSMVTNAGDTKKSEDDTKAAEERAYLSPADKASRLIDTITSYGIRISTDGGRVVAIDGAAPACPAGRFGEKLSMLIKHMQPEMVKELTRRQTAWLDSLTALIGPWNNHLEPDDVMTAWHTPVELIASTIKGIPIASTVKGVPHE